MVSLRSPPWQVLYPLSLGKAPLFYVGLGKEGLGVTQRGAQQARSQGVGGNSSTEHAKQSGAAGSAKQGTSAQGRVHGIQVGQARVRGSRIGG